jgi:hypothetical protein
MINLYKQDGEILYGIKEFLLDSEDDVKDLPTKKIHVGSMAMVIPTGAIYILNGFSEWVKISGSSGSNGTLIAPTDIDKICGSVLDDSLYNILPYGNSLYMRQNIEAVQEESELIIT